MTAELAGSAVASEPFPGDCPTGLFSSHVGQCFQSCQFVLCPGLGAVLLATAEWVRSAIILASASNEPFRSPVQQSRAPVTAELACLAVLLGPLNLKPEDKEMTEEGEHRKDNRERTTKKGQRRKDNREGQRKDRERTTEKEQQRKGSDRIEKGQRKDRERTTEKGHRQK